MMIVMMGIKGYSIWHVDKPLSQRGIVWCMCVLQRQRQERQQIYIHKISQIEGNMQRGWLQYMVEDYIWPHFQNGTAVLQFWPKLIKGIKHLTRQKAGFKLLELGFWDLCLWISNTKKKYNFFVHHTSGRHEIFVWPCLDNIHLQGIFATHW